MPNIKSAKKRMVLSAQAAERNRAERSRLRTAVKKVRQSTEADAAAERLRDAIVLLDRAAQDKIYHPNKVARIKSQLTRHVNGLAS